MVMGRIRREEPSPSRSGGGRAACGSASSMTASRLIRSLSAGRFWWGRQRAALAGSASILSARSSTRPVTAAKATATTSTWCGVLHRPARWAVESCSSRRCGEQYNDFSDLLERAENIARVAADLTAGQLNRGENDRASEAKRYRAAYRSQCRQGDRGAD